MVITMAAMNPGVALRKILRIIATKTFPMAKTSIETIF